jgi:hypothetical protein
MVEVKYSGDNPGAWALSIHDKVGSGRHVDIREIVAAMGDFIDDYIWALAFLDCMGEGTDEICNRLNMAAQQGSVIVLTAEELRSLVRSITQTVDATIFGVPLGETGPHEAVRMAQSGRFLQSRAVILIYVADNSLYAVVTKEQRHIDALRANFTDVRDEDPTDFC